MNKLDVGISVGTATLQPGMTMSGLLEQADQAMFSNKMERGGRLFLRQKLGFYGANIILRLGGLPQHKYYYALGDAAT